MKKAELKQEIERLNGVIERLNLEVKQEKQSKFKQEIQKLRALKLLRTTVFITTIP